MKNCEILLVEDNADQAEITLRALRHENQPCSVHWVKNGQEALDYIYGKESSRTSHVPGLILLDIKLPKVTGIEVLKKIKADKDLRVIPVIILTTSDRDEEIQICYKLGANSFIIKPVKFSEFYEKVKSLENYWRLINHGPHLPS